jgi:hypothetical protein
VVMRSGPRRRTEDHCAIVLPEALLHEHQLPHGKFAGRMRPAPFTRALRSIWVRAGGIEDALCLILIALPLYLWTNELPT